MKAEEIAALVAGLESALPDVAFELQPAGYRQILERAAATETARSGVTVTAAELYARSRASRLREVGRSR
jgi:hypothetical protein